MDADGGHRRGPRRGARADVAQRGDRAPDVRSGWIRDLAGDSGDRSPDAAASVAGQRRGALVTDHPCVRIPDRRKRARGDESAGRRHGHLRRGAVFAGGQGGGERARGRPGARRGRPLDRPESCRVGEARAARVRVRGTAARCGRAGHLRHRRADASGQGHLFRRRQARRDACTPFRPRTAQRRSGRPGVLGGRRRDRDYHRRGREAWRVAMELQGYPHRRRVRRRRVGGEEDEGRLVSGGEAPARRARRNRFPRPRSRTPRSAAWAA